MIKRVEVNYRGITQKNLAKKIGSDLVFIASRMGRTAFSNGRYSDAPERDGIPCKYFTFVTHDLEEEELEAECGAKLDIDSADISVVLDDTMCKGVEPWGWHGIRPINEKIVEEGACLLVVSRHSHDDLLQHIGHKPFSWRLAIIDGDANMAGLWVNKDDLCYEKVLGGIAAVDPDVVGIEAVEAFLLERTKDPKRAQAARDAYNQVLQKTRVVNSEEGIAWPYENPVLPKWHEFNEGVAVRAIERHFEVGPRGQSRNLTFKRGTTKSLRPMVRFDLCIKCTLCWLECPDECFDPTSDGLYDIAYDYCTGCGKCAAVCPVKECIVMVDELKFLDYSSPWEAYNKDKMGYTEWVEEKKGKDRYFYPHVTGKGFEMREGTKVPFKEVRK